MSIGLNSSLLIAVQALSAEQGALDSTTNNIANVNTLGYSREVPLLQEAPATQQGNYAVGNGVVLQGYQSIRDSVLELRIQQETQNNSNTQAQSNALQQVQPYFTASGADVASQMSAFFVNLTKLESDPTNSSLRQGILSAGQGLVTAFHGTAAGISQQQAALNTQVAGDVAQINQLTPQIAQLSVQVANLKALGQDGGTVEDQLNTALGNLSKLVDVNVTQTEGGITVTTGNGTALVAGGKSFALQTGVGSNQQTAVLDSTGKDITSTLKEGDLGGAIQVRDQVLPGFMNQLDTLAFQFANAFNSAHEAGYDLNGQAGQAFFNIGSSAPGSAASLSVAISDPALVAASSDGSPGSNGNVANLIAVRDAKLPSGSSPVDMYSGLVFNVGAAASDAQAENSASSMSLQQLTNQRSALSGVSIDEETTNMIRYQQAYQAAAKVVSTIDQLNTDTLNMIK